MQSGIDMADPPDFIFISARQEQRRSVSGTAPAGYYRFADAGGHMLYRRIDVAA